MNPFTSSSVAITVLIKLLSELNISADTVEKEMGIMRKTMEIPDKRIPFGQYQKPLYL